MHDFASWFLGPRLPDVEIPSWVPASDRLNEFLDWPDGVPRPRINPFNLAKVAADEALIQMITAANGPGVTDAVGAEQVRALAERGLALYRDRGWLEDPASYHQTPPPLAEITMNSKSLGGLSYEHMRFESEFEPHEGMPGRERFQAFDSNQLAHARVLRHEGEPRPWLVCVHGYGMGDPTDLFAFQADYIHRVRGVNVIAYVWPFHGPRNTGRNGEGLMEPGYFNFVHGVSQAIWDLRRILQWLREEQGATDIGTYGLSLGGFTVALLAGLDPDLRCVIAGIPATDVIATRRRRRAQGLQLSMGLPDRVAHQLLTVVGALDIAPKVPLEGRFIFGGLLDRLSTPDRVLNLWKHWEEPRIVWFEGSHLTVTLEPEVHGLLREALDYLQNREPSPALQLFRPAASL